MASDLARKTAELATRDLGTTEHPAGSNSGPRVDEMLQTVHLPPGNSWCAAAVSTWIDEASQDLQVDHTFHFSGSAQKLYFLNPQLAIQPQDLTVDDVPCVYVERHEDGKGHTGIVVGLDPQTGRFQEIAGNTNPQGSRTGGSVAALNIRSTSDAKLLGFVRIE